MSKSYRCPSCGDIVIADEKPEACVICGYEDMVKISWKNKYEYEYGSDDYDD